MPCGLRLTKPTTLKPMKKKIAQRALAMSTAVQAKEAEESSGSSLSVTSSQSEPSKAKKGPDFFLTEVGEGPEKKPKSPETMQNLQEKLRSLKAAAEAEEEAKRPTRGRRADKGKKDWDVYLMSNLSQLTATWIVHERMPPDQRRQDLVKTLQGWYGKPKYTDLVAEKGSDSEDDFDINDILNKDKKEKPKKKWKKAEAS